jgi:N-sulfoglucosamine sulfohydrolase
LLLIADDLGMQTGAYGDAVARTPSLDWIAKEGVRFTNAFCTTASCSASRSVIHSGVHNHANGQYGHAHVFHHFAYLEHVRPLSSLLKDAGYRTGVVGKMHVNPIERFRWDYDQQRDDRNVTDLAVRAKQFIQAAGGRPWFLQIGYGDPHRTEPRGFANKDYPGVKRNRFDPTKVPVPDFLPDNAATRGELAEHYEATNRMDQGIGMVLNALREAGQLESTLIIFIADNGIPFPNAKTNIYDAGTHLPMLVRSPDQSRRGLVNNGFVSWADLTPTILDWAGAKGPEYALHGRSFLGSLEQENPAGPDRVFQSHTFHEITMYYPMRAVRTQRYHYIRNLFPELSFPFASDLYASATWESLRGRSEARLGRRPVAQYLHRPAEELYDVQADPSEVTNLAEDAAHKGALQELRAAVDLFRRETKDPWLINDNYK